MKFGKPENGLHGLKIKSKGGSDVFQAQGVVGDPAQAALVADFLIPDILPVDTAQPTAFFNGRKLDDDVADAMLGQLTNGAVTSDGVPANDRSFTTLFPYLAAPH